MIALALAYFGLAAVALALLTGDRLGVWPKAVAIPVVLALSFAVWQVSQAPTGWASTSSPPKNAEFLWGDIHEPSKVDHDPGWIALWLRPPGSELPRAYRIPYSRQTHRGVLAAEAAVKGHGRVGVTSRRGSRGMTAGSFRFYTLPPAELPSKN